MLETIDRTEVLTLPPGLVAPEAPLDDEEGDWRDFLSSGLQVNPAQLAGACSWRNAPVLLSY